MWLMPCSRRCCSVRSASALETSPRAAAPKITRLDSCPVAPNGARSIMTKEGNRSACATSLRSWSSALLPQRGVTCTPSGELTKPAIAMADCDYDGEPDGAYLLFETRADLRRRFNRMRGVGGAIRGSACSGPYWRHLPSQRSEGAIW